MFREPAWVMGIYVAGLLVGICGVMGDELFGYSQPPVAVGVVSLVVVILFASCIGAEIIDRIRG